ncbi:ABC transporter substrate-binding protein [Crocinitomix sp.]|nr:ABC transporter substrate-binding protein [Crocinitomix sp.]
MRILKLTFLIALSLLAAACGGPNGDDHASKGDPTKLVEVEGGKFEGGVLRINSVEDYTSLFPASINDIYSTHIASQGYEGLLRFDQKTLEVEPCIAESFNIDQDKVTYTFHLRKGVRFIDDDCFEGGVGREVTAEDFKYCFQFLCSNHKDNKWPALFRGRLKGADEYARGETKDVTGIVVLNDSTLQLKLINPYSGFPNLLAILASAVYPHEAIEMYGQDGMQNRIIGTGPFIAEKIENGSNVVFVKNKSYWAKDDFGNRLPFLNEVQFSFIKDKNEELKAFQNDELDMVWGIPHEEVPNIMGSLEEAIDGKNKEFVVQSVNSLNIQYYGFLYTSEVFNDVRIRKAFNYAIDRDSIVDFILQGEGSPAYNGFVPEMKGYPSQSVNGYYYDPIQADELMAEAGYPNGEGFPEITLNLNSSGGVNEKVAKALTYMLNKNLGINILIKVMPMSELQPMVERGKIDFWRFGWLADYPDPSNFLYLFHGKNIIPEKETSINYFRYSNPKFDKVYEEALREINLEKRMALYARADQILINDAVIMPLYFNVDIRLINPEIRDFDVNEMEYRDLSVVYYEMPSDSGNVRVYDHFTEEEND